MTNQRDLNTKRMLGLMVVNTEDSRMPLYLYGNTPVLRKMPALRQENNVSFNYAEFKQKVEDSPMTPAQQAPLTQRLDTLESFMPKSQTGAIENKTKKLGRPGGKDWSVKVCLQGGTHPGANTTRPERLQLLTFRAHASHLKAHAHSLICA
jgi:hypothetical protein